MKKLSVLAVMLVAAGLVLGAGSVPDREMKVKLFVQREEVRDWASDILEFYDAGPGFFTVAVGAGTYEQMIAAGLSVEVLVWDVQKEAGKYDAFFHTYAQLRDTWAIIAQNHPDICVLDTMGTSAGGNLLLVMKISDNPTVMEGEPRICFDFSIHGNENNGCEIAHWSLLQLVTGYGVDPQITYFVNNREIWLAPMDNPDGLISRSRYNAHSVDCNRNYGYSWDGGGPSVFSEPEANCFYYLAEENPMAAWSQYHSGATAAMWPWFYTTKATMDSVIHGYEMTRYGSICGYSAYQISRGLYPGNGGSTDWYYGARGALGYAVEVCGGQPSPVGEIDTINHKNWSAMKEQILRVTRGVMGYVTDSASGNPLYARVVTTPPDWFTYTDSIGYYHKNLQAGTYSVTAYANGYAPKTLSSVVVPTDSFARVNIALARDTTAPTCAFKSITCHIPEPTPNTNPTHPYFALGRSDGRRFSIGNDGYCSFDMGKRTPIINGPGSDFTIVEGDGDPEACSVYVSNDWNGPWHYVGFGTGTQGYDLAAGGQTSARFVRIADDANGGSGPYAGFDLDAIEAVVLNAPAVSFQSQRIIDSAPGGNGDGKLDPGEQAGLVVTLKNLGRAWVHGLGATLRTSDAYVSVSDSLGAFGDLGPDSVRSNSADRFRVSAAGNTPREHIALMKLHLTGTDYADSVEFQIMVGQLLATDPTPDGPRQPALYWAFDNVDSGYVQRPAYSWVEVKSQGTRLTFANNDAVIAVTLPTGFGPLKYYGQRYNQVSVSADGWIAPGNYTTTAFNNTELPSSSAPPGAMCLNWDDLYPQYNSAGYVYHYHDAANHRFVVEYDSVAYYDQTSVRDKFEAVFYDTTMAGPDGNSVFAFQYMTSNRASSNTVGVQDPGQTIGIQCLYDGTYNRGCAPFGTGRVVLYTTTTPTGITAPGPGLPSEGAAALRVTTPFAGQTAIRLSLPRAGAVRLAVFDVTGRLVRQLAGGNLPAGAYELAWNGRDSQGRSVATGVYWLALDGDAGRACGKVVKAD